MKTKKAFLILTFALIILFLLTTKSICTEFISMPKLTYSNEIIEGGEDDYVYHAVDDNISKGIVYNILIKTVTPWQVLIIYISIDFIFLILSIKKKNYKLWIILNIIILLAIKISNFLFKIFIIDIDINGYINIIINIVILITGILMNILFLRKNKKPEEKTYKRLSYIMCILVVISLMLILFTTYGPKLYIKEQDWGFGEVFATREFYKAGIVKGKKVYKDIKIVDIDEEGVLIEYTDRYYEQINNENNYIYLYKNVKQKLLWNKLYKYSNKKGDGHVVDEGTDYYISFTK